MANVEHRPIMWVWGRAPMGFSGNWVGAFPLKLKAFVDWTPKREAILPTSWYFVGVDELIGLVRH